MTWSAVKWALEDAPMLKTPAGKNDSTARLVLVALAEVGRGDPVEAFASLARLRYATGLDMKTVQRALQRLEEAGLTKDAGRRGDGVIVWRLMTDTKRPLSDREAIDAEVEDHRERDRRRKRKDQYSGALRPEVPDSTSGTQGFRGVKSGSEDVRGVASGNIPFDQGTLGGDQLQQDDNLRGVTSGIPDAEPARTKRLKNKDKKNSLTAVPAADNKPTKSGYTDVFEAWWDLYPRKVDKLAASRKFTTALKHASVETLTDGVQRYVREVSGRQPDHIKHAATWLHGRCWENLQPVQDSESIKDWVRGEWKAGRVRAIEERTGLHYTPPDLPMHITGAQAIEEFHANACREWIAANHDQIISSLMRSAS